MGKQKEADSTTTETPPPPAQSHPQLDVETEAMPSAAPDTDETIAAPAAEQETIAAPAAEQEIVDPLASQASHRHLRGLVEALVFAADQPLKPAEIGKIAQAPSRQIKEILEELKRDYDGRGIQLEEIAGGYAFRTSIAFAPFIRDLVGQKPVKLTRAQLETLAIVAYRQPVTRPEVDDIRGVDCGAVLKLLLERDLIRIMGKKDEPGRPILYGTSSAFLALFGLKSLKDLPTLREFTELNEESKRVVENELGDVMEEKLGGAAEPVPSTAQDGAQDGDRPTLESPGAAEAPNEETHDETPPESGARPNEAGEDEHDDDLDDDDDDDDDDDEAE